MGPYTRRIAGFGDVDQRVTSNGGQTGWSRNENRRLYLVRGIHPSVRSPTAMQQFVTMILAILATTQATASDEPQAGSSTRLQALCDTLHEEYVAAYQSWYDATRKAPTDDEARKYERPD